MKLQSRARLGVVLVFAGLILLIAGLTGHAFMRGLAAMELREAHEAARSLRRIVEAERETLRRTARDYSEWDDTAAYATAPTPAYELANWTAESLRNVQVDAMLVYSRAGDFVGGALLPAGAEELVRPSGDQIVGMASAARQVAGGSASRRELDGICRYDGALAFFVCLPVLPTSGEGVPQGALVAVRRIDERLIERLEQILGVSPELFTAAEWREPDTGAAAIPDVRVDLLSGARMSVAVLFRDVVGEALFGLRLELDRSAYQEGVRARQLMFWQLVGAAVLVALLTSWVLRRQVIRRLEVLSDEVAKAGEVAGGRGRVTAEGADEIASVARRINAMLENLERADHERELARRERELLQEQLLHAQRMEAVGEFAGGVAHDFNNCLTSVVCWLQLAKQDLPAEHPVQENIDLTLNSVAHATSVVRQLLAYGRHSPEPITEIRLGELLSESLMLLRSGLSRTIELQLHASGVDDRVMADRTQLLQVVMNLLNNARDAMGQKGTLTISLADVRLPSPETPRANHLPAGDYVRLSVRDSGPGIPADHLERIFKPFFTTKPAGKGTGLGLAVVQSVVSRHNGTVWVESEPGHGATFHVLLPHVHKSATPAECAVLRGVRVLVVEDDAAVVYVLSTALERRGCEVAVAADGLAAWELFSRAEKPFALVLTDYAMPRLNGLQLAERIAESERRVPVLLMTAYGATITPEQLKQAGLAAVLTKPLFNEQIVEALLRALDPQRGAATDAKADAGG
ncbi:MAG TPA: ATP-binding protein [Opitutaceae bacterium]|nr:ATP-binding protein [Opitutaceae bacterium]